MRIYTKIQLVIELKLVFLRGYQRHPNTSETRSTAPGCLGHCVSSFNMMVYQVVNHNIIQFVVEFRVSFIGGNRTQTNIFMPRHVFVCARKQWVNSTTGCILF